MISPHHALHIFSSIEFLIQACHKLEEAHRKKATLL